MVVLDGRRGGGNRQGVGLVGGEARLVLGDRILEALPGLDSDELCRRELVDLLDRSRILGPGGLGGQRRVLVPGEHLRAGGVHRGSLRLVHAERPREPGGREVCVGPGLDVGVAVRRLDCRRLHERHDLGDRHGLGDRQLHARDRLAREAAALCGVPAVAARVLAARQAEVERLVEGVELVGRRSDLFLTARIRHGLGERCIVREHEVAHALAERAHPAEPRLARCRRLEGVAGAAPLAERLGEDFRQVLSPPGNGQIELPGRTPSRAGPEYSLGFKCHLAPWYQHVRRSSRKSGGSVSSGTVRGAMASLADVERFFERVFERSTARLFRARVQPVQLERRVERSMERARTHQGGKTLVPGRYRVRLHPADLDEVASQAGGPDGLAARLADAALVFARTHAYHLPGRPGVALVADPSLARGQVEVDAVLDPGRRLSGTPSSPVDAAAGQAPGTLAPSATPAVAGVAAAPVHTPNPIVDAIEPDRPVRAAAVASGAISFEDAYPASIRGDGTQTLVFRRPAPVAARALLRVLAPDGTERTIEVDGTPLTVGRSRDNGLVLADTRVSRMHGRLQARRGTLVYTDLGSTNGSRVNGIRVDEIALGIGDRLLLGDTVLVVETLPG